MRRFLPFRHRIFNHNNRLLAQDLWIIAFSILVAVLLVQTNIVGSVLTSTQGLKIAGSFVAGLFFTSVFTTAPAIVTLGEIARVNSIWEVALFGAIGAVVGDLVIFRFVKDWLSEHLVNVIKERGGGRRLKAFLKKRSYRWLTFLVGGLIIASPFPDELGISLLGFSKTRTSYFIPLSFTFNFIGILLIGLVAKAF